MIQLHGLNCYRIKPHPGVDQRSRKSGFIRQMGQNQQPIEERQRGTRVIEIIIGIISLLKYLAVF